MPGSGLEISDAKPLRPADEGVPPLVESQHAVGVLRDADAHADADWSRRAHRRAEPQRPAPAQVEAVQPWADTQRRGEPARATREILETRSPAVALHGFNAFQRLDGAQQNSCADAVLLA
jgi:hypothetical protein